MKTIKIIINIILAIGGFMVFNESGNITPNLIGVLCIALLIVFNADMDALEQLWHKNNQ